MEILLIPLTLKIHSPEVFDVIKCQYNKIHAAYYITVYTAQVKFDWWTLPSCTEANAERDVARSVITQNPYIVIFQLSYRYEFMNISLHKLFCIYQRKSVFFLSVFRCTILCPAWFCTLIFGREFIRTFFVEYILSFLKQQIFNEIFIQGFIFFGTPFLTLELMM